jgi:toxin ParE1/3/4
MIDYRVLLTEEAEKDLRDISLYVARHDSPEKALRLMGNLEETCLTLESYPDRGHVPIELERLAMTQYLEIYFKPYRIIYEISNQDIFVHCIMDSRRDIDSVLRQRLLRI